jgi:hypothetical protein
MIQREPSPVSNFQLDNTPTKLGLRNVNFTPKKQQSASKRSFERESSSLSSLGNQYATPDIAVLERKARVFRKNQANTNAENSWSEFYQQILKADNENEEQIKKMQHEKIAAIKLKQRENEAILEKIEAENRATVQKLNATSQKYQDLILRLVGNEAKLQKEEEERKREQERLRKEQELLEKQKAERQRMEEQQRLLAEKKAAEEKAAADKLNKENAEKLKPGGTIQSPIRSNGSTIQLPNRPIPNVPSDYFHPDWIEIIQAHSAKPGSAWVTLEGWHDFIQYHDHYQSTFKVYNSLKTSINPAVKQQFLKFQGKIQGAFNALTTKQRQVDWKIETMTDELNSRMKSELEYVVCIHFIADRLVFQGVSFIQKTISAAYSFAYVAVGVARKHHTLMNFIIAQLYESCPYCVPMIPPRQHGQSKEDYQSKVLKYKKTLDDRGDEILESMATFTKRVCGFITLMATLYCIQVGEEFPRIHKAWEWLTRFLQLKIRPYSAIVLHAFLQASNYYLSVYYKNQYLKLKQFIVHQWWPRLDSKDETPVNQQGMGTLKTFLEDAHHEYLNDECEIPAAAKLSKDNSEQSDH